jgi:hypothetical protein
MPEPVNRWKPATDFYKEQAAQSAAAEVENEQKLKELHEANLRKPWTQGKAPLGIRIFTWYYFGSAGFSALLLLVLASVPHSDFSNQLFDTLSNSLQLPGSKSEAAARRKALQEEFPNAPNEFLDKMEKEEAPAVDTQTMHNLVMILLLVFMGLNALMGFGWWIRWWFVRWATMFRSGATVAKIAIAFVARSVAGPSPPIPASAIPLLILAIGVNGIIFLYLAFGQGVKQWFEPGLYQ